MQRAFSSGISSAPSLDRPGRRHRRRRRPFFFTHRLAVFGDQHLVARFVYVGHLHSLRGVARDAHRKRPRITPGDGLVAEGDERRGLVATHEAAQVRCVRRLEGEWLTLHDFARAQHFHRHAARLSIRLAKCARAARG